MNRDLARQSFEQWYNAEYIRPIIPADRTEGGYQHPDAQSAWDAWQSALSHAEGEAVPVDIDAEYKAFCRWCRESGFNLDYRLHTHSGRRVSDGAYIRDENARRMFRAWRERAAHPAPLVAGLTETAIKSSPAYRALHREKEHLLGLLKEQAPQVAEGHIPVPRALVERWANVDAFQAPKGAAMELKTIAQQMLVNFDAKAPKTAPRVAVPEGYALVPVDPNEEMLDAWFTAPQGDSGSVQGFATAYRAMLAAAPTAPAGEPVVFPEPQEATTIEEYVGEYEYTDGEGHNYSPTETERALILDAIHGIPDHLLQPPKPAQQPVSDSDGSSNSSRALLDQIIEQLEGGFVACSSCGDQEDTATLDVMSDLLRLRFLLADAGNRAAPDEREIAALALERHADNLIVMAERDGRNSDRESQQTWEEAAYFAKQEAARLRAGKEGE